MTKQTKKKPKKINKPKIQEIAGEFDAEFKKHMKLAVLPNGAVGYKDYVVKLNKQQNWCICHVTNQNVIDEFKLKSCALLAAKAYDTTSLDRYFEIKELDNQYWASHSNTLNCKRFMNKTTPLDRYIIILNKLEESERREALYKDKITSMFHASFA